MAWFKWISGLHVLRDEDPFSVLQPQLKSSFDCMNCHFYREQNNKTHKQQKHDLEL